jgi:hypothetical protein
VDTRARDIIRDQERLQAERSNFETQWEEIAERVIPRSSKLFYERGHRGPGVQGEKKTEKQLDATAAVALDRYAAVMASLLTPRNQKWHRVRSSNPDLNRVPRVLRWFDAVTDLMFAKRNQPRAGFSGQMNEVYGMAGAFGTGPVYVDWAEPTPQDRSGGLRYRATHLSEIYMRENHQGVVDAVHRVFQPTARQIASMVRSGVIDRMPDCAARVLENNPDQTFRMIHCIKPNDEYSYGRLDWRGKPWASYYVVEKDQQVVGEGGYTSFPYAIGRAVVSPGEVYGRSPAMTVLPNIKVVNAQKEVHLKIGHRMADPVLLAHDDGVVDNFSLRPGAINYGGVNAQGQRLVQRLDDNVGQLPQIKDMMEQERAVINDAFLVSLFQILVETPQMTATEVLERTREKSMLLAPTMGRFQEEFLGALIEREMDILARKGLLPPIPPEVIEADAEYEIVYDSPLNRSMRAEEMSGFMRLAEVALNAANVTQNPAIMDTLNFDAALPEIADGFAVPSRWLRSPEEIEEIRSQRNEQMALQQAIDAAPSVAALAKVQPSQAAR